MELDRDPGTQLDALLRKLDEVRDAIVENTNRLDDYWADLLKLLTALQEDRR